MHDATEGMSSDEIWEAYGVIHMEEKLLAKLVRFGVEPEMEARLVKWDPEPTYRLYGRNDRGEEFLLVTARGTPREMQGRGLASLMRKVGIKKLVLLHPEEERKKEE